MKRPIKITGEIIQKMTDEFIAKITSTKMLDGKIDYTKTLYYPSDKKSQKARVLFTPSAYIKMLELLKHYGSEVAWHGTVERQDVQTFLITDILVYPQEVTGVTVNTDQEAYQKWMMGLDDEVYNKLHVQMHSHVNMGTSPSSVDLHHQEEIINQLTDEDFYIFMIWNKKLEYTVKIYDMQNNVMYDGDSVIVDVETDGLNLDDFITEADEMVKTKAWAGSSTSTTNAAKGGKKSDKGSAKTTPSYPSYPGSYGSGYYGGGYQQQDWYKRYTEGDSEDDI